MTARAAVSLLLLAVWLGAAGVVSAVVAPAAFAVLPTRALAGALVGRVLPVVFVSGILVGIASAWLAWAERARTPMAAGVALAVSCAVAQFVVGPRIERVRAQIGPSVEALAATDPLRVAFGRLHAFSVLWLGVGTVAALVAVAAILLGLRARR